MNCLWYRLIFTDKESFDKFHSSFNTVLMNMDDYPTSKGNTIYLPDETSLGDFRNIYISLNPDNREELGLFLQDYNPIKIDKPDNVKYYDGNNPIY